MSQPGFPLIHIFSTNLSTKKKKVIHKFFTKKQSLSVVFLSEKGGFPEKAESYPQFHRPYYYY